MMNRLVCYAPYKEAIRNTNIYQHIKKKLYLKYFRKHEPKLKGLFEKLA